MKQVTFITGNAKKAEYLAKYLGHPVEHEKLDLDEIQHPELSVVVRHKVREAYRLVRKPVLVEDVSLEFKAWGRLPGTFIKWFVDDLEPDRLCSLLDGQDRSAVARCMFGYFDGVHEQYFEGGMAGSIAERSSGSKQFGWDNIFIPEGYSVTRSELSEADDRATYLQIKPLEAVKHYLETL
jgi:inosine triphosphate pyrophosphatase